MALTMPNGTEWQPPPASALNLDPNDEHICELAADWVVNVANDPSDDLKTVGALDAYIIAILPSDATIPDNATLKHWIGSWDPDGDYLNDILAFAVSSDCTGKGDPDVSGEGMIITYFVAAGLATLYLLALLPSRLRIRLPSKLGAVVHAVEESTSTLLDATLIFALSMLGASLFQNYRDLYQYTPDGGQVYFFLVGSQCMSAFSLFPPFILQILSSDLRRNWVRIILWCLSGAFNMIIFIWSAGFNDENVKTTMVDDIFALRCLSQKLLGVQKIVLYTGQALLALGVTCKLLDILYSYFRKRFKEPRLIEKLRLFFHRKEGGLRIIAAFVCSLVMWAQLGTFYMLRQDVNNNTGQDNRNSEWTFGQILSLTTWIPAIVELVTIIFNGPETGLSKKVSRKYQVVRNMKYEGLEHRNTSMQGEGANCHTRVDSGNVESICSRKHMYYQTRAYPACFHNVHVLLNYFLGIL
ncbi:hypothetical protein M426DRAFT_24832 [Hypoxylon sp. CI-4A]|nr:hypothetical protein M426DRAFT_24832 [Hypoxylon sp. CI-4A]